jgi:hypothetical protein
MVSRKGVIAGIAAIALSVAGCETQRRWTTVDMQAYAEYMRMYDRVDPNTTSDGARDFVARYHADPALRASVMKDAEKLGVAQYMPLHNGPDDQDLVVLYGVSTELQSAGSQKK